MVKEPMKDKNGQVLRVLNKEPGFLYFVDSDGTVMRAKMSHGGKRLSDAEVKRREKEKEDRRAKYEKRIADSRARRIEKLKAADRRSKELAAARAEKIKELAQ